MARKKQAKTPEQLLGEALVPCEEHPYAVPDNWRWVRASAVLKPMETASPDGESFDYIDIDAIDNKTQAIREVKTLPVEKAPSRAKRRVHDGDTLFSMVRPYLRNIAYVDSSHDDCVASTGFYVCSPNAVIDRRYLYHLLCSDYTVNGLTSFMKGDNSPSIKKGDFDAFPLPIPPLAEQRRIVKRVGVLFAKLDEVENALNDVLRSSQQRVHALLREAFSGDLSMGWRAEHDAGSRSSWKRIKLIEVLQGKPRNGFSPKPVNYETGIRTLSLSAVTSGEFRADCFKYVDIDVEEDSHLWLEPGDILLQRSNSLDKVGKSALYTGASHGFIYPDLMMKLQVNPDVAFSPFIAYQLKTPGVMNYLREHATGTAGNMPKVNQATVCNIPLVLPCKEEQVVLAKRLDNLIETERKVFECAAGALSWVKNIRASVLQRALAGRLGTNNPAEPNPKATLVEQFNKQAY
ncbi:restriction endonuclease subunit S [Enorma sp.]|uniref:restriction endonuclease subunit S n=1 Tax=Enorma sp. TaxID=1920692 RepID=UPI0025BC88A2|nr:restriction endonuclease subunit S [Enorma sp.]